MRQQSKRIRGRGRGGGGNNGGGGGGGKGPNPLTRSYESNGPDVKIRGTAGTIADKYVQLSRDALSAGDPVAAENYLQHAEHYYRLLAAAQAQYQPHQTFVRADADDFADVDFDDDGEGQPSQDAGGQPNGHQAGGQQPAGQQNGQPNYGQPRDQNRNQNNGRQNGYNGQQPRDGGQQPRDGERRFDRNDRRPYDQNRQDGNRQDGNRQDGNRQDGGRQDGSRYGGRDDRPSRSERNDQPYEARGERPAPQPQPEQRAAPDDQPDVGGLPAFITGGAPVEAPAPAPAPTPRRSRAAAPAAPVEAVETPAAAEPVAAAESSIPDGDPRDDDAPAGGRTRRRRYGRYGRGPAAEDGGAEPAAAPSEASD